MHSFLWQAVVPKFEVFCNFVQKNMTTVISNSNESVLFLLVGLLPKMHVYGNFFDKIDARIKCVTLQPLESDFKFVFKLGS